MKRLLIFVLLGAWLTSGASATDVLSPASQAFSGLYVSPTSTTILSRLQYANGTIELDRPWVVQARREIPNGGVTTFEALSPIVLLPQSSPLETQGGWTYQWAKSDLGKDALLAFEPTTALVSAFIFDQSLARRSLLGIAKQPGTFYANDGDAFIGTPEDVVQAYKDGNTSKRLEAVCIRMARHCARRRTISRVMAA